MTLNRLLALKDVLVRAINADRDGNVLVVSLSLDTALDMVLAEIARVQQSEQSEQKEKAE